MLYELRTYLAAAGRMADMDAMMSRDCTPVFRRHRIPQALGAWIVTAGPRVPAYLWALPWPSMDERNAGWAAFGADPQWQQIRRQAHQKSELTVSIDTRFMTAWPQLPPPQGAAPAPHGTAIDLWLVRVHTGLGGAARESFLKCDRPVLESLGARIDGAFDVLSGENLPVIACFLRWPDAAARERVVQAYDAHPEVRAARAAEHAAHGCDLFVSSDRYAMHAATPLGS